MKCSLIRVQMETIVASTVAGTIKAIHVKKDDGLDAGDLLIEIEPEGNGGNASNTNANGNGNGK